MCSTAKPQSNPMASASNRHVTQPLANTLQDYVSYPLLRASAVTITTKLSMCRQGLEYVETTASVSLHCAAKTICQTNWHVKDMSKTTLGQLAIDPTLTHVHQQPSECHDTSPQQESKQRDYGSETHSCHHPHADYVVQWPLPSFEL